MSLCVCVRVCVLGHHLTHQRYDNGGGDTRTQCNGISSLLLLNGPETIIVLCLLSLSLSQTMENNPRNEEDRLIVVRFRALLGPYGRPEESRIEENR